MTQPDPACLFCRIVAGEIPSTPVYRDTQLYVFPDVHPRAPVHLLIVPIEHLLPSIAEMSEKHIGLVGQMVYRAKLLAEEQGIAADGYRLVFNVRQHGGQEVDHVHLHLLGGQPLGRLG
ncbi:MAG: histidine triad nucleotide-binding protein [Candidatus Kerfeldbacteria bacterium]|nr:histidine triad nucleotide-binding protein [Candidatus Kerfeldbacteria bacterium]